jgi:hypothetical protein
MAELPWSSSLQRWRLALVPLRRGNWLRKDDSNSTTVTPASTGKHHHQGMIPLWHTQTTAQASSATPSPGSSASEVIIVVGRQDLLPCLYAACGCHSNIHSTQHKCPDCQQVNQWAPYALSRQMLRFTVNNAEEKEILCQKERSITTTRAPRLSLQVRGVHARVSVKNNPSDTAGGAPPGCSRAIQSTKEEEEEEEE